MSIFQLAIIFGREKNMAYWILFQTFHKSNNKAKTKARFCDSMQRHL